MLESVVTTCLLVIAPTRHHTYIVDKFARMLQEEGREPEKLFGPNELHCEEETEVWMVQSLLQHKQPRTEVWQRPSKVSAKSPRQR